MNPYTSGILVSMVVYLVVAFYAGRKVRHLEDYFVAGRQAPTLLIVGTLVASFLSTNAFLGETGMAYSGYGTLILITVAINVVGYVGGAMYFGRHLRRSRALTVAEYFGQRFASRRVRLAAGVTIIVGLGAYLMAVTQGAALIVTQVSDMPYGAALFMVWLAYTMFTLYAGSRGVVITDTMMFLIFSFVSVVALSFIVAGSGGWFATIEALAGFTPKPGIIAWHGMTVPGGTWETPMEGLVWALILGVAWSVVVAVSPWQASRYLMARDEHTVIRAGCGAGVAIMVLYPVLMLCGAAINLQNADIEPAESAMIWAALNLMPTLAGVLLMTGIMAAALSSATTFLSLVGFSVSNDIVQHVNMDERKMLRISRFSMLGVSLTALVLASAFPPQIFWLTYFAGPVFASSWGPIAFMSVWSRRVTAGGAFWGIVSGFAGNVVPKVLASLGVIELPVWADPIIIGAILSTVTIILVSRRGTVTDAERRYLTKLHEIPAAEIDAARMRRTRRWPTYIIAGGIVVAALMIGFYALPYGAATGDDAGHLFSGEFFLSLAYALTLIASGVVVRRAFRPEA